MVLSSKQLDGYKDKFQLLLTRRGLQIQTPDGKFSSEKGEVGQSDTQFMTWATTTSANYNDLAATCWNFVPCKIDE